MAFGRAAGRDDQLSFDMGGTTAKVCLIEDGRPLVGMVAGLRVMKGHRVVIEAAARLAREGVRPRIVFVGRGAMEGTLR